MNQGVRHSIILLAVAMAPVGCSGIATFPVAPPAKSLTVREARKAITEAFAHAKSFSDIAQFAVNRHRVAITWQNARKSTIIFADISSMRVERYGEDNWWAHYTPTSPRPRGPVQPMNHWSFQSKEHAVRFAEALLAAQSAESAPDTEEPDFAAFRIQAQAWINLPSRPAMPETALTLKAVAEEAFKRKDFVAALHAYGDALDKFPMWPEGQYNAALLAGEVDDFELAAHHMRRYLALAPDAKDAPTAREKYLLWRHKAKS